MEDGEEFNKKIVGSEGFDVCFEMVVFGLAE